MKASDLNIEGSELQHKVRTVSDLIRHIKTREADSETANYNLFFGAGCSVTSGIRPAGKLIEEWIFELYERFNTNKPDSIEEAKKYLETNHSSWYNKDNAYSSLFEKTYEFASQRRRFVETEVDKTLPAIGYAYLTSLVTHKYFNTIFTTNFDDLINEAFYQFSNERPLLCAHDSSIKSISITSKRPKIIKLHGDYLFDDIKSTLRETESLEQNTKEKLIEFCKEFGLIVVGYAGNDRSIMDVLDFLTKQDNYLKNGVYWCLRKDDEINRTLQKLFWKDKVYPIIIDGYDELFAEIHTKLIGTGLDFEKNIKNSKLQQIKKKILDENNPLNLNPYINADIKSIKETNNKQEISDFLSELNSSGESGDLSLKELRDLLEIEDLLKKSEYDKAYKLAEDFYYQADDIRNKSRFISMLILISDNRGDPRNCLIWCDRLVEIDPNNISYIIKKSQYITDLSAKYSYLEEKTKVYSHRFRLYNSTARAGCILIKNSPGNTVVNEDDLINMLDESLKLNPSLSNHAWLAKIDVLNWLKEKYERDAEIKCEKEIDESILEHVISASEINNKSLVSLKLELQLASSKDDFKKTKDIIEILYCLYKETDVKSELLVDGILSQAFSSFMNYDKKIDSNKLTEYFFEKHLQDKKINSNSALLLSKGTYFVSNKNQLEKAETYLLTALDCSDLLENFQEVIFLNQCLSSKYTSALLDILVKYKTKIVELYYYEYKFELSIDLHDYPRALEYLEKSFSSGLSIDSYYSNLSYLLLLSGEHNRLIDIGTSHSEKIKYLNSKTFIINYQYAAKQINSNKYDPNILRNIIANTKKPSLLIAAFSILEQEVDAKRILSEQIEISFTNYYRYKRWPIISEKILNEINDEKAA